MSEIQKIRTEGRRIDPPRNVERIYIEVEAVGNGCTVEGRKALGVVRNDDGTFTRQPTRIEIYVDRLNAVLGRTRTDKERRAYQMAVEAHGEQMKQWMEEHKAHIAAKKTKEERERWIHITCNLRPEHNLAMLGYPRGLPPLESCKVIHPQSMDTMDAREWLKLPAERRAEWLVEPPLTPTNAGQRSAEQMANAMVQALRAIEREKSKK
jgi:hypothetical protein